MSKASHTMPEADASAYEPQESSIDPFDVTPQLAAADGESTVSIDEVEGGDRSTESVKHGVFDSAEVDTTTPSKRVEADPEKKTTAKRAPRTAAKAAPKDDADADKGDA